MSHTKIKVNEFSEQMSLLALSGVNTDSIPHSVQVNTDSIPQSLKADTDSISESVQVNTDSIAQLVHDNYLFYSSVSLGHSPCGALHPVRISASSVLHSGQFSVYLSVKAG